MYTPSTSDPDSVCATKKPYERSWIFILIATTAMAVVVFTIIPRNHSSRNKGSTRKAKEIVAATNIRHILSQIAQFQSDCGMLPSQLASLQENPGISGWRGPYIGILPLDPWGRQYYYRVDLGHITIGSSGPDGAIGSSDDITLQTNR